MNLNSVKNMFLLCLKEISNNRLAKFGSIILILVFILAIFGPTLAPHDPTRTNIIDRLSAPNTTYYLGTDAFGRDVFSRILFGARLSLRIASQVVVFSGFFGIIFGILSAWFEKLDNIIMRFMDALMAFPSIVLALAIMAVLGPAEINLVVSIGITQIPRIARVMRATVMKIKNLEYVESAWAIGSSDLRILLIHIVPNSISPVIVQISFVFATVIITEAGLSFVGAGVPPPAPSWGSILAEGRDYIRYAPWLTIFPGIAILISVLGLNLLGDGLRDILDPKV